MIRLATFASVPLSGFVVLTVGICALTCPDPGWAEPLPRGAVAAVVVGAVALSVMGFVVALWASVRPADRSQWAFFSVAVELLLFLLFFG